MWGETAEIEGIFKKDVKETQCSENFLKYMKVILMKSPNNEGDGTPIIHCHQPISCH